MIQTFKQINTKMLSEGIVPDSKSQMSSERENVKRRTEIPKLRDAWNKSRGIIKRKSCHRSQEKDFSK